MGSRIVNINSALLAGVASSFKKEFNDAFAAWPSDWARVAMNVPSVGDRNVYQWDDMVPMLVEWKGDREMSFLKSNDYTLTNVDYAKGITVSANDIADDKLNLHLPRIKMLAQRAKQLQDKLIFGLLRDGASNLGFDGKVFFATDHPNGASTYSNYSASSATKWYLLDTRFAVKPLVMQERETASFTAQDKPESDNVFTRKEFNYGAQWRGAVGYSLPFLAYCSSQTFNKANIEAAIAAMNAYVDMKGEPLEVNPNVMVIPPSLKFTAKQLLTGEVLSDGIGGFDSNELKGEISWENTIVTPYVS